MTKQWISIIGCLFVCWACGVSEEKEQTATTIQIVQDSIGSANFFREAGITVKQQLPFSPLLDSSYYYNKDSFALAFQQHYQLPSNTTLLEMQHRHLYGAIDTIFWLRFVHSPSDTTCQQPLLEQHFILDHQGQLLEQKMVYSGHFLDNAIDSIPIFITVEHNCEGEGYHHAYIVQEGKLVDILNVFFDNMPLTFDAKADSCVFQAGGALQPQLRDVNQDGYPDLLLQGKKLQLYSRSGKRFSIRYPYRRDPLCYYFLYEPAKELFIFEPSFK
ncbi:MAG: hypothetical protein AB8E82_14810 [Aureispira sp.]